jgi:hypothetical protein
MLNEPHKTNGVGLYIVISATILVSLSLLFTASFENAVKIQQYAMALNSNFAPSAGNSNTSSLNIGPPQKMTLSEIAQPPTISTEKRQALEQGVEQSHKCPPLPSSGQLIHGPELGTKMPKK